MCLLMVGWVPHTCADFVTHCCNGGWVVGCVPANGGVGVC